MPLRYRLALPWFGRRASVRSRHRLSEPRFGEYLSARPRTPRTVSQCDRPVLCVFRSVDAVAPQRIRGAGRNQNGLNSPMMLVSSEMPVEAMAEPVLKMFNTFSSPMAGSLIGVDTSALLTP